MKASQQPPIEHLLLQSWTHRGFLACVLWPVSLLFGVAVACRRQLYQLGFLKIQRVSAVVVVVGNVVAGGSGKTPVVIALVNHLHACGLRVGVISRGYGRRTIDCREVLLGSQICDVGDEPHLIKRTTNAPVFVAAKRITAASELLVSYPEIEVIVCDDGLQHFNLHRDITICTFDDRGVGNGFVLPAGPLREPWPQPIDFILHTGNRPAFKGFTAQRSLSKFAYSSTGTRLNLKNLMTLGAMPLVAVAAIAKPNDFFTMLRNEGLILTQTIALPDHYDFNSWKPSLNGEYTLLCTEKDAVKLWKNNPHALAIPLIFIPEPSFLNQFDALLYARLNPLKSSLNGHSTS